MNQKELLKIINYIIERCNCLKDKYVQEKFLKIDYICIFSHSKDEYSQLEKAAKLLGKVVDKTTSGPVFALNKVSKIAGANLLKIRKPDQTRPQRGDVDFNTDYLTFKRKYLDDNRFKLIKREKFEMIELRDDSFDVLVYFLNIPPSKQLGPKKLIRR